MRIRNSSANTLIVEDGLAAVALEFHVTYLHLETHLGGDAAGLDHGVLLAGYSLLPALDIALAGLAVNLLEFIGLGIDAFAFELPSYDRPLEGDYAEVVTCNGFHDDHVAYLHVLPRGVAVETLAGILEAHLEDIPETLVRNAVKVIVVLELAAALTVCECGFAALHVVHRHAAAVAVHIYILVLHTVKYSGTSCPPGR